MTMTEVLAEISSRQRDALTDGKRLLGLFDDYSCGKLRAQSNALRVLVECGGNERIARLRTAPALQQKTEMHRLMQEMIVDYNMKEASVREVCDAVWIAFCEAEAQMPEQITKERAELVGLLSVLLDMRVRSVIDVMKKVQEKNQHWQLCRKA